MRRSSVNAQQRAGASQWNVAMSGPVFGKTVVRRNFQIQRRQVRLQRAPLCGGNSGGQRLPPVPVA